MAKCDSKGESHNETWESTYYTLGTYYTCAHYAKCFRYNLYLTQKQPYEIEM